jgi:23S rRNA pseudouridine1911/1915/1917 synthase
VQGVLQETEGRIITRIVRDPANRKCFAALPDDPEHNAKGKIAVTSYRVLKTWNGYSLVLLKPKTGRTHQLRVHLNYVGNPILGDPIYNPLYESGRPVRAKRFPDATLMLHASSLSINIPEESSRRIFKAPLPDRFTAIIGALNRRGDNSL